MSRRRCLVLTASFLFVTSAGLLWLARNESPDPTPTAARPSAAVATTDRVLTSAGSVAVPASASAAPVGTAIPQNLMIAANDGNNPPGISTRALAARGKTVAGILAGAEMSDPETRARVVAEMRLLEESQELAVQAKARLLGIPLRIDGPGHQLSILHDFRGDEPLYRTTLNKNAAISSAANLLAPAPYSLNGSGVKVGIWDGGSVRSTHQELSGRVTLKNPTVAVDDHATHVAGTIGASGVQANAKGMSPAIRIDSYDWEADYAEMTGAGAATAGDTASLPLSNHSYGYGAVTADMGRYEQEANSVDAVAASLPYYLPFWASGNEQDTLTAQGGFQSITFNGLAKNILTVGAVDDAVSGSLRAPAAGRIAYFSSLGPCDDGRIKPDLVANGVDLYSSISTSNTAYDGTYSGTSMATPSAMGSSALLVQLYAREFSGQRMRASTLKSLLLHTATDVGTAGPDYKYGWGLINVQAAADLILAHKASLAAPKIIEGTITSAAQTHTFTWDGVSPIRATLCWTDPAGTVQTAADSRTANLKNNLDAKITAPDGSTNYQPYVMPFVGRWTQASMSLAAVTGKNNVDNMEQIYLAAPSQAGNYTLTVSLDGAISPGGQVYSLVVTGGLDVESNPPPNVALTSPAGGASFLPGVAVTVSATATDLAIGGAPGSVSQVEFFNGTTSLGVDSTAPYSVSWTPTAGGTYSLTARATDDESAVATSAAATIAVLTGDGQPVVSSFSPASGSGGSLVVLSGLNFVGVTAVRFNALDAVFTVDSAGQITATVPALATSGTLSVVNAYGTGTSATPFTVLQSPVLISQIYGGAGNTGGLYRRDYVELYNRSESTVSLAGWSVQYASSTGTSWTAAPLIGSIAPGHYYLVGLASVTPGLAVPTVDASATMAISATTGKIALISSSTALSGSSPLGTPGLQDFVGYGAANAYETAAAPSPSTTTAIFRAGSGATDSGNNALDFTTAAPLPRNSTYSNVAPVITSATTASGVVGSAFSYQISASGAPASYAASGLPAGLLVNATTGAITGTPSAAGSSSVTLSATNSAGTGTASLTVTITAGAGGNPTELFSEDFASIATGNNTATAGSSTAWTGNPNFPTVVSAWQAGGAVKLGAGSAIGSILSKTLDLSANGGAFNVSFKVKGWTTVEGSIKVTVAGLTAQTVTYTSKMADAFETKSLNFTGGTAASTIKFETTAKRAFLDDIVVSYSAPVATPLIATIGSLGVVDSTYGSASPVATSFSVSGSALTAGILLTPPAGFEISQTAGGTTGFAASQTLAGTGTITNTPVYLRLAAGSTAGTYSGNVTCTSAGAAAVNVPTALSEVRKKLLTITADDRSKPFGSALALGSTAFSASGLVGGETLAAVTLSAGGTAADDAPGVYPITPANASGGTADLNNYDLNYLAGNLTVTPLAYADWLANYPGLVDASATGDPDGDGISNLMEYFSGLSPAAANGNGVTVQTDATTLSITYRRAKGIAGVTGTVEWSADLSAGDWSSSGVTESSADRGTYEEITATVTRGSSESRKLMRLKVSQR